jgi:hypothetical protein
MTIFVYIDSASTEYFVEFFCCFVIYLFVGEFCCNLNTLFYHSIRIYFIGLA